MESMVYQIHNLKCSYDNKTIVLDIEHLEIPEGKIVFFVGSSGVGKSTVLETLGLMNRTILSCDIFTYKDISLLHAWDHSEWSDSKLSAFRNEEFSFIFQQNNLMPNFSAHDNIITAALFQGETEIAARKKAIEILKRMDLPLEDRPIQKYSGGQLQRLAFARAILPKFSVFFGDEPTGNLDSNAANKLMHEMISAVQDSSATAIIVSHDVNLATRYADIIVQIEKVDNEGLTDSAHHSYGRINDDSLYYRVDDMWYHNSNSFTKEKLCEILINKL